MYTYKGLWTWELGDFEVIEHKNQFHVFHLCLENHDVVGHIVSDDGLTWRELPNAIYTGHPGECDDDHIWTMGVFKKGDTFFMLYTAKKRSERGNYERTALATSKDLIHWTKYEGNPVAQADPRWYDADTKTVGKAHWRDAHIIEDGGVFHALIAAREKGAPINYGGCPGHFVSRDGYRWKVQAPLFRPRVSYDYEVPSIFRFEGRYYVVALPGAGTPIRSHYRVADRLEGPWRRLHDDRLLPDCNHAFRPCHWRGKTYLFHWTRKPMDWLDGSRGCCALPAPKEVVGNGDGTIYLRSFDGWLKRAKGRPRTITPRDLAKSKLGSWGKWSVQSDRLDGFAEMGTAIRLAPGEFDDFILDVTIEPLDAIEVGVMFRADDAGDRSTSIQIQYHTHYGRAVLQKHIHNVRPSPWCIWRGRTEVQSEYFPVPKNRPIHVHIVVNGPYVEASLNDRVVLCDLTMTRRSGHVGVFVVDGRARFSDLRVQPIRPPHTDFGM